MANSVISATISGITVDTSTDHPFENYINFYCDANDTYIKQHETKRFIWHVTDVSLVYAEIFNAGNAQYTGIIQSLYSPNVYSFCKYGSTYILKKLTLDS